MSPAWLESKRAEGHRARCCGFPLPTIAYITEAGAKNVAHYRYSGSDNSFMYRRVLSPLADVLVRRFVPLWMAPNVITSLGLVFSLLGHGLVWYYSPDLQSPCPRWCWAALGCCTLIYQTLDNMDGKQARRTGTSSPLGLLFDHGIDALNLVLSALNIMAMYQMGDSSAFCMLIWATAAMPFFFATWEEFHVGHLYLGFFNGPTDGVLILAASQFWCAWVEDYAAFWAGEACLGLSWRACVIGFYVACVFVTVLGNLMAVAGSRKDTAILRSALSQTIPFCASLVLGAAWLATSGAGAFARSPRLVVWLMGLPFLKMVVHLQLAHVCAERYNPWRRSLLPPVLLLAASSAYAGLAPGPTLLGQAALVWGCVALLAAACMHLAWHAVREMARALDICVFTISTKGEGKAC